MRHPPSSLVVWLAIVVLLQAAVANAVRYEITGHYAEIRPNDVEGNDTNYDTQAEKIQGKISELVDDDNLVFVLNRFETHGKEVNFPSVIFYGYFTSETNLGRSDIIDRFEQADDAELYFLGEIDEIPVITRRLPHEEKNQLDGSLCNNGVMLKNQTCVCAPFVAGQKCDQWMCMNHGVNDPVNQGRCGCPPGFTSAHCEFGGCQPAVESAFQFYDRTFILVFSQKSSMGWELNLLIRNLDNVFTTIYERTGQSILSYIFAGFRQSNLAFYLESNYFETKGQFITYLKGVVTGNGDDRQPVMRSIYEAQKVSAKMHAMSTIFVFTDSLDSNDTDVQNLYASNPYTQYVAKTITWRNKPTIFLSQATPFDTSDSGFTVLQNFVTATHGDFIVANKSAEMNTIITQMLPVFYQTENIHVKFGATTVDAFEVESDDPTQTVYALISVTQQTTLPGLAPEGGGTLPVAISGQQFTLYNFTQTASIKANLGDTPYNLRLFVISADTILVSNANDPNADGGAATAFNQIGENTFIASTLTNTVTNVTQDIVDLTNGKTPLTPQRSATNRSSSCSWPFIIVRSEPIYNSGGPYVNKIAISYQSSNVKFTRVIPGFSISADGHADLPFECLNGGSRTGPSNCACTSHWEGASCEMPLCAYGGTPNQFPSPDEGPCECPVGYGGDFCDQLSCFQPKPDPKFSFKNRTIALIVQNSLTMNWTSADIASGINDMILQMNGTGMFTNFLLTTFHLKKNILGHVESFNQTTNFEMDTDFLKAVNDINYSSAELGNPLALDALRYAIDTGFVYYKSSVMLFTDSAPNSTYGDSVYTQLADVAIELELEISIILTPPNNDKTACPTQNDLNIYYKLAKETGGNFLNLCQIIQTLNAFESPLPASLTFFIENSTTSYYAYINSESIENYTAIITNLDDQSQSAPLTSIAGLPFVSTFQLPQLQINKNGYSIQFTSGEANPNYTTHFRIVIRSPLNVFSAFANNPEIDYDFASPIWSTPINVVAHISTVLQSASPSVQILSTDAFGNATKIYDATSTDRAGCTYEYYFLDKFYCPNRDDSLYVTATFQTPEAIITRSKRLYCYLQEGLCANGGEPINGDCGCNPVEADGRFCEHVRCHNGATNINNICHCAQGYTGTNCQDMNCTDGYNYLVADDDYVQSFEQGVRDKLLATVPRFITAISKNLQDTQRHYSLILFDDTSVRRVMTTSDPDAFNFKFAQLVQQDNFKSAPVRTMEAIDAAHSMRVRNWHQIFVFTTSNHFDSGDVGKQQIFRTQVNVINIFTSDMPSLSSDSDLLYVTRQSNGRIIPIQNDQGQFDRVIMKSGSCYIQARIISDFKVRVGFTSDPTKDHVKNLPFSGIGTSSSLYTTTYYNGGFYDYPDLFDCWTSDTTYPWVGRYNTPLSLYNITRDSETCAIVAESPIQTLHAAKTGKLINLENAIVIRSTGEISAIREFARMEAHQREEYASALMASMETIANRKFLLNTTERHRLLSPYQRQQSLHRLHPHQAPGCTPIACNSSAVKYLVSHMIDATDHAYMTNTFQPIISQLAGDVLAGQSRFTIGGASYNYHPYPNNVTTQSDVATAIQYIVNLNVTNGTNVLFDS
ncbi:hypothetical protein WR25_26554 [Diploscapter pachys]|uniref:EGF-like domain-containing protein n=1 Tax=Diploscapter pachys TaxID=2018661 RepID=A0A2A2LIG9_9BILA|nr:hypothetical protein WR25_26554 [Diploscapter pachys]